MKNVMMVFLTLVFTTSFVNAINFNSISDETQKTMLHLCQSYKEKEFKKYRNNPLWKDRNFVYDYAGKCIYTLKFADKNFKSDREIVTKAVKNWSENLEYANIKLRNDREFILNILNGKHSSGRFGLPSHAWVKNIVKYLGKSLQTDKDIMSILMGFLGLNLHTLNVKGITLKDDKELILHAMKNYDFSSGFVTERLQKDKKIDMISTRKMVLKLCPNYNRNNFKKYKGIFLPDDKDFFYYLLENDFNGDSLRCIDKKLLDNKEVMLDAVTINARVFQYASERLRKDRDVVSNALKKRPYNMKYVGKPLLNDKNIVLLGLKNNGMFLQYVDEALKNDKDVVREAFKARSKSLQYASNTLKNNKEYMLELANINHYAYDYIGDSLKKDKELALIGLVWWEERLEHMDISFRDDPEIVLKAMEQDTKYLQFGSNRLRSDKEFILNLTSYPRTASTLGFVRADAIKYVTKKFKNNKQIMLDVISKNALTYRWIGESLKEDRDICLATVEYDGNLLRYLSQKCRLDREIVKTAVRKNGYALKYADKIFRNDKEIVKVAVKSEGRSLHYASLTLKKDKELIGLAKKSTKPYVKSLVKRTVHPDAWESYIFEDTLEILYGKDANFIQNEKLKITDGIKIETDLKLKSIAILLNKSGMKNLVAWYPVNSGSPVNLSVSVKHYGNYTIIGEGLNGDFYISTYTKEEIQGSCFVGDHIQKEYEFFNAHLKRKIMYDNNTAHVEFMIVNDTLEFEKKRKERKKVGFTTKVRIEAGGKTVFTMHTNEYLSKNPYFTVDLVGVRKDENLTIYNTDTQNPKEYVWEDKVELVKDVSDISDEMMRHYF